MNTKRTRNETLSLKLSPEVAKIMPWIVAAKASGKPGHSDWAKKEHERAEQIAREREEAERAAQHRREWLQHLREQEELERREWHAKKLAEQRAERAKLERIGAHLYRNEFGEEEFLPSQSSQKGWRRLLSECPDLQESGRYGMWGCAADTVKRSRRNRGRKPRSPWFKKTRAQH